MKAVRLRSIAQATPRRRSPTVRRARCVSLAAFAEGAVLRLAERIMPRGDAGPVADGLLEAVAGGEAAAGKAGLAGLAGGRSDAAHQAQGATVSAAQELRGFGRQRGEDDPARPPQGLQDLRAALPFHPRRAVRSRGPRGELVDPAAGFAELVAEHPGLPGGHAEVGGGGLGGARRDLDRAPAQAAQRLGGVDAPDAVAGEDGGDRGCADAAGLLRGRRGLPQLEDPSRAEVLLDVENLRAAGPEPVAGAVRGRGPLRGGVGGDAAPLAELDRGRIGPVEAAEAAGVGPQGIGKRPGVSAVVLGAGGAEAGPGTGRAASG